VGENSVRHIRISIEMVKERIFEFLFCDGPVISDLIRCLIYSYLLLESILSPQIFPPIGNSPLQAHVLFQRTHPLFWCIQNKFSGYFVCIHKYEYIRVMVFVCKISWICCIIGFGGILTRLLTGLLVFILLTMNTGIGKTGVSHRWYVPTWTLLSLILIKNKRLSIDYLINEYVDGRYNVELNYSIFDSGFASKLIQCVSLYTLFAGGISKLRHSGIEWIYPSNLAFHLSDPSLETYGIFPLFRHKIRQLVLKYDFILLLMSTSSLFIELISIVGIFIESTRVPIVIGACLFHFGIWFLLSPNFVPQCLCYLMLIGGQHSSRCVIVNVCLFDMIIISVGVMIVVGHVFSLIIEYEGWPLTSIPMFSLDRSEFTHEYILDENQFERMIKNEFSLLNGITIGGEDQFSEGPMWIRITKNEETRNLITDISNRICVIEHGFRQSLWSAVMRSILISRNEIDQFLKKIFEILLEDKLIVNQNDFLNLEIHFRKGWKTFSTTKCKKWSIRDLLLKLFSSNEDQQRICAKESNGNQLTIGQLKENAEKIALSLMNCKRVGICMSPSLEVISTICGVILRGIPYVPIDPQLPLQRIKYIQNDSQIQCIIRHHSITTTQLKDIQEEEEEEEEEDDVFCLMYTSGSTGQPKCVRLCHDALINRLNWQWSRLNYVSDDICCLKSSISFVDFISELFGPLLQRIPIVIIPKLVLIHMNQLIYVLSMEKITRLVLVPSLLSILIDSLNDISLLNLRFVISSGENLSVDLIKSFFKVKQKGKVSKDCCLINFYGSTEVMGDVTYEIFEREEDLDEKISMDGRLTSIGYPIDHIEIEIDDVDEQGIGELIVRGANVANGYSIGSAKTFFNGQFATGDLVQRIDNRLFFFGRKDRQIKIHGNRIDLNEIEFILKEYCHCQQPLVIFIPNYQMIVVFLEENEEETIDICLLKEYLPSYAIPSQCLRIPQIPYLTSGKIDRQSLLNHFLKPFDEFGISRENLDKDFFALGGTSLNAIQFVNKLHQHGFTHITLQHLLNSSTLNNLFLQSTTTTTNEQWEIIPLNQVNKNDCFDLIIESFSNLGEIDGILHCNRDDLKVQHRQEWFHLLDQRWKFYTENEKSFSFGIVSSNGNLVGISLCNDFDDEPSLDLETIPLLAPVFHFIEINQTIDNNTKKPILHNFLSAVNINLSPKERLEIIYYLEREVLTIASKHRFRSVLTVNAGSVTQQLAQYVFKYEINRSLTFIGSNGKEQKIVISIKEIV